MAENELDFNLVPTDDETLSPADELAASIAGAVTEDGFVASLPDTSPAVPFGRTWIFDFETGRFLRAGTSPVPTTGFGALQQWVLMAVKSARFAHAVFSDDFGMEEPDAAIGELFVAEGISDYEQRLREAVLVHDRVTALENFEATYDPVAGVLAIAYFEVVTDEEERVPVTDITLGRAELEVSS
jgi:hypothetical protein